MIDENSPMNEATGVTGLTGADSDVDLQQQLAADSAARARALELRSFLVEAPAGAGKTELLTQRYLALLAGVDDPEEIVAITFTNKAAAEMRNRVLASLQQVAEGKAFAEPHRAQTYALGEKALARSAERGWDLLAQPARLRMLTIDALCASLARQMPVLSRIGAAPQIADDPQALYEEAARLAVEQLEGEDATLADGVAASLVQLDNNAGRLVSLLANMLARRDQWLRQGRQGDSEVDTAAVMRALVERDLVTALNALGVGVQARLMSLVHYATGNLTGNAAQALEALADWREPLPPVWEALPQWQALAGFLLTTGGTLRKKVDVRSGFPAGAEGKPFKDDIQVLLAELAASGAADSVGDALLALQRYPALATLADDAPIIAAFARLLRQAVAELRLVFNARREVDFTEVTESALAALGDAEAPSDLALRLDYRISHLLVDEFQDTSPTQVRLLERLTAGWVAGDGRTLFCVGDPMQSIYRFRKADVGLFVQAGKTGVGGIRLEPLRLYRNNRSCPAVVAWINQHFPSIFASTDDVTRGAVAYRPCAATRSDAEGAGVFFEPTRCAPGAGSEQASAHEASAMLRIIDATWAEDSARSIAVLVRARSHLATLIAEIRSSRPQLRFQAVELEPLGGRQWVQDLLILTRAMLQLADRVNWLALLRSPLCGLRLADLHALAAGGDRQDVVWTLMHDAARLQGLCEDGRARLEHLRSVMAAALARRGAQTQTRWIESAWLQLGGATSLPDASALEDCKAYFALLERLEGGDFWIDRLAEDLEKLYAAADTAADAGRLKLMTIHKAKGLQFDTVILPGLHKQTGGNAADQPLLLWDEVALEGLGCRTVVAALPRRKTAGDKAPSVYGVLQQLEQERDASENVRVLYVALTRAERAAYLLGSANESADGASLNAPREGTPLRLLWSQCSEHWAARPADCRPDAQAVMVSLRDFTPHLLRQRKPQGSAAYLAAIPASVKNAEAGAGNRAGAAKRDVAGSDEAQRAALVGTLTHRYLEWIARDGLAAWPLTRLDELRPAICAWLGNNGLRQWVDAAAEDILAMLKTTLNSEDGRRVLAAEGDAELALIDAAVSDAGVQVIDRSFIADGVRWVVDYKTSAVNSNDHLKLQEAAELHREQLMRYAALFAGENLPVRCAVFFVRYGLLVELADTA